MRSGGFKTNPYDFYVANKSINGKQCTIRWHVDDIKISHEDPEVVTTILGLIDARYGQEIVGGKCAPFTITRGKIHDYLGMTLDFTEDGIVKIDMREYVEKALGEMPDEMDGTATTPAASHLFQMRGDAIVLEKKIKKEISFTPQWQSSSSYANAADLTYKPRWPSCAQECASLQATTKVNSRE